LPGGSNRFNGGDVATLSRCGAHSQATANYMVSSGLAVKGYTYVNVDEGWNLGRDPKTNKLVEDKKVSAVPR
jgi:hypothetical protein